MFYAKHEISCLNGKKSLTILDAYTRACHVLRAEDALRAADVPAWLAKDIKKREAAKYLRSGNRPEFIAREIL